MTDYFYMPAYYEATKDSDARKAKFAKAYIEDFRKPHFLFDCEVPSWFRGKYVTSVCNYLAALDEVIVPDWFK